MERTKSAQEHGIEKVEGGDLGRLGGYIAHRILERWDFAADPNGFRDQIDLAIRTFLTDDQRRMASTLTESLQELFSTFGRSEIYAKLRVATILGREVPFVMPWADGQVMEGVIDLICQLDGRIWIADYKTDSVPEEAVRTRAEAYRRQAESYKMAVRQSLGISSAVFRFIFLRPGVAVEM
jgi:ATP-dependent helicase/nuclease subunit A